MYKNKEKKIFYTVCSLVVTLLIGITVFIIAIVSKDNFKKLKAESVDCYEIIVEKTPTITVYVSGVGVRKTSSTNSEDTYAVEKGTEISLRAINESKIFLNWDFSPTINGIDKTSSYIVFTPTSDLRVNITRRDPLKSDFGTYIQNSFVIDETRLLLNLRKMFEAGTTNVTSEIISYYDEFFAGFDEYASLNATQKGKAIIDTYFFKLQNGYFTAPTSFAIFENDYYGIGTDANPFKGVFCGLSANQNTSIFLTTICAETSGVNYSGLFGVTEQEAVIRNLKLSINVAFSKENNDKASNIYVGGVAGRIKGSYLTNLNITSRISVSETKNANIYVGAIAGLMENGTKEKVFGLNDNNQIKCNLDTCEWLLGYQTGGKKMMAGIISGMASNTYVKDFQVDVSSFSIKTMFTSVNTYNANTLSYVGNLFGYYENSQETSLENINIMGNTSENLLGISTSGNIYVGGLIGYVNVKNTLTLGKINYNIQGIESRIVAQAQNSNSRVNLYTGGLIAKIDESNGYHVTTNEEFRNNVKTLVVDGVTKYMYEPIFEGNITISSIQKGQSDGTTFGKSVAGGLVGFGYINMNGTSNTEHSKIVLSSNKSKLKVNAIQSSTSTGTQTPSNTSVALKNDKEHCVAGLIYGLQTTSIGSGISISNIDIYAENVEVEATREVGSTAGGDLHTGGFAGYSYCLDYENINLLINNAEVSSYGYSYDGTWGASGPWGEDKIKEVIDDSNNVYTGGFVGEFSGSSSKTSSMKHVTITGFDYENDSKTGATLSISSLQNTPAPKEDYSAENYVGGVIGRLYYGNVDGCTYEGKNINENQVRLLADKSPDTSFCGGVIGFVKNNNNNSTISTTVSNCLIKNVNINSNTTVILNYGNPDMYTGGIIGASFNGGSTGSILTIDNCRVYNCNITSIGNEKIVVYSAGILGINTWNGTTTISNCSVCDCNIEALEYKQSSEEKSNMNSFASGIMAEFLGNSCKINNCAVIDTSIHAQTAMPSSDASTAGILARGRTNNGNYYIYNCYSNARLSASAPASASVYGIANGNSLTSGASDARNSYYIKNNISGTSTDNSTLFRGLNVATITIDDEDEHDIFVSMGNNTSTSANIDKYRNKFYPIFMDDRFNVLHTDVDSKIVTISKKLENRTGVMRVWINSRAGGSKLSPKEYKSDFERNEAGWFLLTEVLVKTGESKNEGNIGDIDISYPVSENEEYIYNPDADVNKFANIKYPYNVTDYIGYEENRTQENVIIQDISKTSPATILRTLTVSIFDNMPSFRLEFTVYNDSKDVSLYYPAFFDENGRRIDTFINKNYGTYTYNKVSEENVNNFRKVKYVVEFTPNYDLLDDVIFYLGFRIGTTEDLYAQDVFKVSLVANKISLIDFQYAEYTIPSNYADSINLGYESNPWLLRVNKTMKIIPIFTKKNDKVVDGKKPRYISEDNIQYVNFTLSNNCSAATVSSNGELKTNTNKSDSVVYYVTLTLKNDSSQNINVYFKVVDVYAVSYNGVGSNLSGLLWTNTNNDYYLNCPINYGFGGNPIKFNVTIQNGTTKQTYDKEKIITNQWVRDESNEVITQWDINTTSYTLTIPHESITGDINIEVEFEIVYAIIFDSQTTIFNPETQGNHTKKYLVPNQTLFSSYFTEDLIENELHPWVRSKGVFGYVFRGFYLIDNANSMVSYGSTFNEIVNKTNLKVNTTYTFYARWSFLVEIIEAPGTHVKTSFAEDFLDDYGTDSNGNELPKEELDKLGLNRAVTIPINNNRGYAFTIEKDKDFVGKASVQAYICSQNDADKDKVLTEITIEKYHENMYIYYIPPEFITGYLVICTSVSSSELIVGENTATVTDTILPEDGIYTFKYVVNHFNKVDEISYIYNSSIEGNPYYNLSLNKDVLVQFYKEVYDKNTRKTTLVPRTLPENTVIEVYYNQYVNGELILEKSTVGTYKVSNGEQVTQILLSEFQKLNYNEPAFENITFAEALGTNESFAETYYFVITPPNGYNSTNEVNNNIVYVGYYDANKANTDDPFVSGRRNDYDLANQPLDGELSDLMTTETSKQIRVYTTTPSRITTLQKDKTNENQYILNDIKDYSIFNLDIIKGSISDEGYISLTNRSIKTNTIVESQKLEFGIIQLKLLLGFGLGDVEIYGKTDTGDWELVNTITLTTYEYSEYTTIFDSSKAYSYFRIDSASENEIRIKGLSISSLSNGMTYDFSSKDIIYSSKVIDGDKITLTLKKGIVGDTRHDGKQFVLAVQLDKNNAIVENIPSNTITIKVNGNIYYSYKDDAIGRNVSYFNLTTILESLNSQKITVEIIVNGEYTIRTVQLLESVSIQKPAMAEVRENYSK